MADGTGISWSMATWNPLIGCTAVSPGCDNCYAEGEVHRRHAAGLVVGGRLLEAFPAEFDTVVLRPERFLTQPLRWSKPRRIFVNSLSDLFHKDVPDEFIASVFAVMAAASQHTFQLLTKRHGRMRSLLSSSEFEAAVYAATAEYGDVHYPWPLPNVWLGVSAEDGERAALRLPALAATPAAVRWVSAEPLLGPVDFSIYLARPERTLDWVVLGGESGAHARRCEEWWVRHAVDDCRAAGVPVFVKQMGSVWHQEHPGSHPKGGTPEEWPVALRVREYPTGCPCAPDLAAVGVHDGVVCPIGRARGFL